MKDHQLKHRDLIKLQVASVCILFVVWELVVKCACGCPTVRYDECWLPYSWQIGRLATLEVSTALELQPAGAYGAVWACNRPKLRAPRR